MCRDKYKSECLGMKDSRERFSTLEIIFCAFFMHPEGINPAGAGRKIFCEGIYVLWVLNPACLG